MADYPDLSDHLRQMTDQFFEKKKFFFWNKLIFKPTGEQVHEGFRYFHCPVEQLLDAYSRGDFAAIANLPFAIDGEGDEDTSSVCLYVSYTDSGSVFAAQPEQYQNYCPTAVAPPVVWFGAQAQPLLSLAKHLDQTN